MSVKSAKDLQNISRFVAKDDKNSNMKVSVNPVTMVVTVEYNNENKETDDYDLNDDKDALQKHQKVKKKKPKHTKDVDDYGIRKVFKAFKDDINAGVSADELMEVFHEMGYKINDAECARLKQYADADGNGKLDIQEFVNLILFVFLKIEDTEDEVLDAFKIFDYGDTGFIPSVEMRRVLFNLGDKLSNTEMDSFIQKGDLDRDGNINYGEFTRNMIEKSNEYEKLHKL